MDELGEPVYDRDGGERVAVRLTRCQPRCSWGLWMSWATFRFDWPKLVRDRSCDELGQKLDELDDFAERSMEAAGMESRVVQEMVRMAWLYARRFLRALCDCSDEAVPFDERRQLSQGEEEFNFSPPDPETHCFVLLVPHSQSVYRAARQAAVHRALPFLAGDQCADCGVREGAMGMLAVGQLPDMGRFAPRCHCEVWRFIRDSWALRGAGGAPTCPGCRDPIVDAFTHHTCY